MSSIIQSLPRSLRVPMLFSVLTKEQQHDLRAATNVRRFGPEQIVQQRGEEANGFWLLESGSVSVGQFLPNGEFRAAAVLGSGDSWGELAMFAASPRVVDAVTRSPSEIRFIHAAQFEALLKQDPSVMRKMLSAMSAQLQETLDLLSGIRKGSARPRIASLLMNLAGRDHGHAKIAITQQELGELLGLTRATVNGALRELERDGTIRRSYGTILVLDREALSARSIG